MNSSIMLIGRLCFVLAISAYSAFAADKDKADKPEPKLMSIDEVPEAVKATLLKESQKEPLEEIEQIKNAMRTVYETKYTLKGNRIKLVVGEDGKVISRTALKGFGKKVRKLAFSDLPKQVQSAIGNLAGGSPIKDSESVNYRGALCYEAEFVKNGKEIQVLVDGNGQVLHQRASE